MGVAAGFMKLTLNSQYTWNTKRQGVGRGGGVVGYLQAFSVLLNRQASTSHPEKEAHDAVHASWNWSEWMHHYCKGIPLYNVHREQNNKKQRC